MYNHYEIDTDIELFIPASPGHGCVILTGKAGVGDASVRPGEVQGPSVGTTGCEGGTGSVFHSRTHQSQTLGV